jgi:hypothetical protein
MYNSRPSDPSERGALMRLFLPNWHATRPGGWVNLFCVLVVRPRIATRFQAAPCTAASGPPRYSVGSAISMFQQLRFQPLHFSYCQRRIE